MDDRCRRRIESLIWTESLRWSPTAVCHGNARGATASDAETERALQRLPYWEARPRFDLRLDQIRNLSCLGPEAIPAGLDLLSPSSRGQHPRGGHTLQRPSGCSCRREQHDTARFPRPPLATLMDRSSESLFDRLEQHADSHASVVTRLSNPVTRL
ncbi:hypothetical protein PsYK624_029290 [Phanerochaete sordida]|uniref:Uncharacterized protein n=1 Tax=Phanerochaete sordida TaxID=48140 RepID=A0A9P3L945_9APHY|nr:hypothetical protein PsYK624_029290 [Phanerochaete sordida]